MAKSKAMHAIRDDEQLCNLVRPLLVRRCTSANSRMERDERNEQRGRAPESARLERGTGRLPRHLGLSLLVSRSLELKTACGERTYPKLTALSNLGWPEDDLI